MHVLRNCIRHVLLGVLILIFITMVDCFHLTNSVDSINSAAESLENLELQLNSILEIENHENKLLDHFLDVQNVQTNTATTTKKGEIEERFWSSSSGLQQYEKEKLNGNVNEVTEEKKRVPRDSSTEEEGKGVIQKLAENSKIMESVITILADLKNVLAQAVTAQENQMALRTEVIELREEIDYLRHEVRKMKSEREEGNGIPKLENRIHNDEATLEWLKESIKELRHELVEVSSSINVSDLLHIRQQFDKEGQRMKKDFQTIQKQIESLAVGHAHISEAILEGKGDIVDIRTWQAKMGKIFVQDQIPAATMNQIKTRISDVTTSKSNSRRKTSLHQNLNLAAQFETDENERSSSVHPNRRHSHSHSRKLRKEMKTLEKMIMELVHHQSLLDKRFTKLEMCRKGLNDNIMSPQLGGDDTDIEIRTTQFPLNSNTTTKPTPFSFLNSLNEDEENQIISLEQPLPSPSLKLKRNLKVEQEVPRKKHENYGASTSFRLSTLERSMADYANTLESIDFKVIGLNELKYSNTQLFTSLEGLETKYDESVGEIQSTMAKLEASLSSITVTSGECKEQQKFQSGIIQGIKKDIVSMNEKTQCNSLRVASIQSQVISWGIKTCIDKTAESIQNIKIATLERRLNADGQHLLYYT